jgi:sialate O-acetylesterase
MALPLLTQAADLSFSRHTSDNMVLQREKPVLIRGFADRGAEITVCFAGQTKKTKADDKGEWTVTLDVLKANAKGAELTAKSNGQTVKLTDVLIGDVFLFARQTTIDISLGRDEAGQKAAADVPGVRVVTVKTLPAYDPQPDLAEGSTRGWTTLSKEAALKMDAAAFYMAKDLAKKTDVPIGIIDVNLGRHFPIAWLSKEALLETKAIFGEKEKQIDSVITLMAQQKIMAETPDHPKTKKRGYPLPPAKEDARYPAAGYNAVLYPLRGLALKGLLLQLGNDYPYYPYAQLEREGKGTSRAHLSTAYEDCWDIRKWGLYIIPLTTPRLPKEWRKVLGDDTLPIGWITPPGSELAVLGRQHCEVREVQRQVADKEKGVDLILPGSESIFLTAQPADDALLGARCLTWLQGAVYKQDGVAPTGPVFDRAEMQGSTAQIFFKPCTAKGLKAAKCALDHFEVAAVKVEENPVAGANEDTAAKEDAATQEDLNYTPAKATLDGETIRLSSDTVQKIAYIRYNWREKPDQGLTGASGLPAMPFSTDGHDFPDRIQASGEEKLPPEFFMSIADWTNEGPVIYDGQLETGYTGGKFLGPTGLRVTPAFGRNLYVNNAYAGSPAEGRILHGDFLYGVNGKPFGTDTFAQVAEAITQAETEKAKGIISFDLLRNNKKLTVELQLEVLGTYSDTAPYHCPKTDRIVANAEALLAKYGGTTRDNKGKEEHPVFANAEALFLLAAGSPEYQGLVRRQVYNRMAARNLGQPVDPDGRKSQGGPWDLSADMLLMAEYYLATGDQNVLPYMRLNCDNLTSIQIRALDEKGPWPEVQAGQTGGWRHNFYGGAHYGTMPAIGVPAALGYQLTKEAGVEYNFIGCERAAGWFLHNGAQIGSIVYGYFAKPRITAEPIDPDKRAAGMLSPGNGAVAGAAILFKLRGNEPVSRTCSHVATHAYNNTFYAHGGNFWANLWTPLGAKLDSKESFQLFMRGNRNYQELNRMHNHSRQQGTCVGVGQYLAYVAPRERLRILGAHESVFAPNPPAALNGALAAYHHRDYAACEKAVRAVVATGGLKGLDLQKAEQLRDAAVLLQKSIALDLAKVQKLIAEKKPYEAGLDLAQLKAVMPEGSAELGALEVALNQPDMKRLVRDDQKRYSSYIDSLGLKLPEPVETAVVDGPTWREGVSQGKNALPKSWPGKAKNPLPEPTPWRMKIVESITQAPEGWTGTAFDDGTWMEGTLPLNWRENHTALLRAPFDVTDPDAVKALQFNQHAKHMDHMSVYINGRLVARVSAVAGGRCVGIPLNDIALKSLKKGRNVLAVTYQHHLRWGSYSGPSQGGLNVTLEMQGPGDQ